MPEVTAGLRASGSRAARTSRRRIALAAALVLVGAVVGFTARCGSAAFFVNVGNLAAIHGADDLVGSAFDTAATLDPGNQAASNYRLAQALILGDYQRAADELSALRVRGGTPRGVAGTSSVLLHLEAILTRRAGNSKRALSLIRESVARAGVNAPDAALRLLAELAHAEADRPFGPPLASVELPVDQRRDSCAAGRRLARVHLSRNELAIGGWLHLDLAWQDAAGRPAGTDSRLVHNLAPNGAFTWGATSLGLPLGYGVHPLAPAAAALPQGDAYLGFADLDGLPVSALVVDNRDGPARTSRLRGVWIPATPGACYLLASEVWVGGGQPHFGLYLRTPGRADGAVFGLQGGLPDGWWRQARLVRLPADLQAIQPFFWNYRSSGATAFTLALVARIDG